MIDRADPHARERAIAVAREDPPSDLTPDEAVAAVQFLAHAPAQMASGRTGIRLLARSDRRVGITA
jgi:hypothetical protein